MAEGLAPRGDREEAEKEFEAWKQELPVTDAKQKDKNGSEGFAFGREGSPATPIEPHSWSM